MVGPNKVMVDLKSRMVSLGITDLQEPISRSQPTATPQSIQVVTETAAAAWQYSITEQVPIFNGKDAYAYPSFKKSWEYADAQMTAFKYTEHQKLQKLHLVLAGEPYNLVKGLAVTDESYAQAWATLDYRFNNPQIQYLPLLEAIFNRSNMGYSRQASLDILTKLTNVKQSIQALNLEQDWASVTISNFLC